MEAATKLQRAKDMGEHQESSSGQRLKEEQDALKEQIKESEQTRELETKKQEALTARLMASILLRAS